MELDKIREDKEITERYMIVAMKEFALKHGKDLGGISISMQWISCEDTEFMHPQITIDASIKI